MVFGNCRILHCFCFEFGYGVCSRTNPKGQTEVEQIIEADQVTKLGGVQVASYDVGFYTLGFMNEGQFSKFVNLNQEKIIYSETRDELLEKSHVS